MAKVRVHELAKTHDMSSQDVLDKLRKAGIKVKAPASAVDEDQAKAAIESRPLPSNGAAAKPGATPADPAPAQPAAGGAAAGASNPSAAEGEPAKHRPTRSSLAGERAP